MKDSNLQPALKQMEKESNTYSQETESSKNSLSSDSDNEKHSIEERMTLALSCKDYGNIIFKECNFEEAKEKYKEGLKHIKDLSNSDAIQLEIQLNSNSCMCSLRLENWNEALEFANAVLKRDNNNIKALFRRGQAKYNIGLYNQAKDDFLRIVNIDPKNVDARKELIRIKEVLQKEKDSNKKAYSGLFEKASGLYNDREAEIRRKRQEEEDEQRRQRLKYDEEMKRREDRNEGRIEFDEWMNLEKEKKESARRKTSEPPAVASKPHQRKESKGSNVELDEEDEAIIKETKSMGYCYFRRELTEEEKKLNSLNLPKKIECNGSQTNENEEARAISSWNSAGTTYEEKDVSSLAKDKFVEFLQQTMVHSSRGDSDPNALLETLIKNMATLKDPSSSDAALASMMEQCYEIVSKTTSIRDISGEAHIAVLRGTRRFLFEFKCEVLFEIVGRPNLPNLGGLDNMDSHISKEFKYTGALKLPEVSSADGTGMCWLDGSTLSIQPTIAAHHKSCVMSAIQKFKEAVVKQIELFLEESRKAY